MNETLNIVVDMSVPGGYVEYCRFFMHADIEAVQHTFDQLLGMPDENSNLRLRFSLLRQDRVPYEVLSVKYCQLDELSWNCRLITCEIFRYYNLDK